MSLGRLVLLLCVFFFSSVSTGQEFKVGEAVIVTAESTDVMSKQEKLGSVPRGTKFEIRQRAPSWLMGEFRIQDRTVLGWVKEAALRRAASAPKEPEPYEFSWENLLFAMAKLDKHFDVSAYWDDYLEVFRPAVWKEYRNDEFQLAKKKAEALEALRERIANFDLNRDFVIRANLTIGKYDFDRSAFPVEEATTSHYWYERHYPHGDFPERIEVYFSNPELMRHISLPPDKAEQFLASRKNSRGEVNRRICANVHIRLRSIKEGNEKLLSEIRWAQFFADDNRTTLLYETPKPPPEEATVTDKPDSESDVTEAPDDTDE